MSQFFTSGGQSIGVSASASVLPMNIQDWFSLGWTGLISLQSKGFQESSPTPQFKSINSSVLSFLDSSGCKEFASNAGDPSSIPGSGRSAGEGILYPLQYSWVSPVSQLEKNLPAMQVDLGLIPALGRSPGEGKGYPLQYSCLENPRDGGAIYGVA